MSKLVNNLSCADIISLKNHCEEKGSYYTVLIEKNSAVFEHDKDTRRKNALYYVDKRRYYEAMVADFGAIIEKRLATYHNELIRDEE